MSSDDIQGKVTDASGNAVANALVALWSQGSPNNVITTQTDSNGNYIFNGHPDGDGTSQNWHIATRDPNDGSQQFPSLHSVSASLPAIPDSDLYYSISDEDEGTNTFTDSIGSNNATSKGTITWVQDDNVRGGWYAELQDGNDAALENGNIISRSTDWSIACEVYIDDLSSGELYFWGWGDGSQGISAGIESGVIGASVFDGSTYNRADGVSAPSTPFYADVHVTYDSSAGDVTVYVDEATGAQSHNLVVGTNDEMVVGARVGSNNVGLDLNGMAAFAWWDSIVAPSEFTE